MDIKIVKAHPAAAVRLNTMRPGIVALEIDFIRWSLERVLKETCLSPSLTCSNAKANDRRPKPRRQPHTLELDQAYVVPPHCSASSRHAKAAARSTAPGISSRATFCGRVKDRACGGGGMASRANAITTKATDPMALQTLAVDQTLELLATYANSTKNRTSTSIFVSR